MKQAFVALLLSLSMVFCGKNVDTGCQPVPVASEETQLIAYCNTNGITYTKHPSGLFYQIINQGSGPYATTSSTVSAVYTGKHLDNTVFEATANPISFVLSGVIDGWKIGIPLIQKGGRIKLIIPSALAYSCTGSAPTIKANEPLFFDVTVSDIK